MAQIWAAIQRADKTFTVKGMVLTRKITLKKIPVKAARAMMVRRRIRKSSPSLIERILGSVSRSANGPEKRMLPIIRETTSARDSIALLSNLNWNALAI
jgi:hypothetical protein